MQFMFFLVWFVIILTFFSVIVASTKIRNPLKRRSVISDDGHVVPASQDLTCETKYGHHHGSAEPRYIVHEEAVEGYVVLNGIKRSLEECKYL